MERLRMMRLSPAFSSSLPPVGQVKDPRILPQNACGQNQCWLTVESVVKQVITLGRSHFRTSAWCPYVTSTVGSVLSSSVDYMHTTQNHMLFYNFWIYQFRTHIIVEEGSALLSLDLLPLSLLLPTCNCPISICIIIVSPHFVASNLGVRSGVSSLAYRSSRADFFIYS